MFDIVMNACTLSKHTITQEEREQSNIFMPACCFDNATVGDLICVRVFCFILWCLPQNIIFGFMFGYVCAVGVWLCVLLGACVCINYIHYAWCIIIFCLCVHLLLLSLCMWQGIPGIFLNFLQTQFKSTGNFRCKGNALFFPVLLNQTFLDLW